jgi:hypothetical protein
VEAFEVALELTLIGADGFAEAFVIRKDGAKTEREDGGMLEAIGDNPGVIDAGLLVEGFIWVMFTYDDGEVTGGVEENLVATDSRYGFEWDWFAMAG